MEHQEIGKTLLMLILVKIVCFQFERDKKLLKCDERGLYGVLRQIKPSEFQVREVVKDTNDLDSELITV